MDNNDLIANSLINKINNIINYLEKFDNIFKHLTEIKDKNNILPENIKQIAELTELFIFIRSEHGSLLVILNNLKMNIITSDVEKISDKLINKYYTLSTFHSILENVSHVISNIDFQYKTIASKFPKFINKKTLTLLLIINENTNNVDVNNKNINFKNIIHQLNEIYPENVYKTIETNEKIINIRGISNKDLELNIKNTPSLFMINGDVITEISLEQNNSLEQIKKLIN
jgi:hypothetical protein